MAETVEFTKDAVKAYLDDAILAWRAIREGGPTKIDAEFDAAGAAPFYIDAFQSVRVSLLGSLLE